MGFYDFLKKYGTIEAPQPMNPEDYAGKAMDAIPAGVPYSEMTPEHQKRVADGTDATIEQDPMVLKDWKNLGTPGVTGQYIQEAYSSVLPDQILPTPPKGAPGVFSFLPSANPPVAPKEEPTFAQLQMEKLRNDAMNSNMANLMKIGKIDRGPAIDKEVQKEAPALDVGEGSVGTKEALLKAQETSNDIKLRNNLGKSFDLLGAGIIGHGAKPVAQELYDQRIKDADSVIQNHKDLVENQKNDPNSPASKAFKQYAEKILGKPIKGDFSAAEGEKILPFIFKGYEAEENRKMQKELKELQLEALKEGRADRKQRQSELDQDKKDNKNETMITNLRKELTAGQLGKVYETYQNAKRGKKVVSEYVKNPTGYKDYGTLMLALKSLQGDSSVVREAEMKMGKDATSLINKGMNAVQSASTGKSLQPEQRQDIIKALTILSDIGQQQYVDETRHIYHQASRKGLPLDEVFSDPTIYGNGEAPRAPKSAGGKQPKSQAPATNLNAPKASVRIRHKKSGAIKLVPAGNAEKFLSNPEFEMVP